MMNFLILLKVIYAAINSYVKNFLIRHTDLLIMTGLNIIVRFILFILLYRPF